MILLCFAITLFYIFWFYDRPFFVCNLEENSLFSTLILAQLSRTMSSFTGITIDSMEVPFECKTNCVIVTSAVDSIEANAPLSES